MRRRVLAWGPALVWIVVILVLAGEDFSGPDTRSWITHILGAVWPDVPDRLVRGMNVFIRKGAHFFFYLVLGVLLDRALRLERISSFRALRVVAMAAFVSLVDEGRQALTSARTGSLLDCGLDTLGAATGVWLTSLGRRAAGSGKHS